MSKEGIFKLRNYLGANDSSVFDPLFIAQYLLCPVNTIVSNGFVDWMMEKYMPPGAKPGSKFHLNDKMKSKKLKTEIYLKYTLLVDLMKIVKLHGRKPSYNWDNDTDLSFIKNGEFGEKKYENDRKKQFLAFDGFTTIWLITLPEKFKEWYNHHLKIGCDTPGVLPEMMKTNEIPKFPKFETKDVHSKLLVYSTPNYTFLPKSWNLLEAFEYYLKQEALWLTDSIKSECHNNSKTLSTMFATGKKVVDTIELDLSSDSDEEEEEEEEKKIEQNENLVQNTKEANGEKEDKEENEKEQEEEETDDENRDEDTATDKKSIVVETVIQDNPEEEVPKITSGRKRRTSDASTPKDKKNTTKKKRKNMNHVNVTAASSTIHSMSAKLNNCMIKVLQLETMSDDDSLDLIQELKNNLEQLNIEKEILVKYIQQQAQEAGGEGFAEV